MALIMNTAPRLSSLQPSRAASWSQCPCQLPLPSQQRVHQLHGGRFSIHRLCCSDGGRGGYACSVDSFSDNSSTSNSSTSSDTTSSDSHSHSHSCSADTEPSLANDSETGAISPSQSNSSVDSEFSSSAPSSDHMSYTTTSYKANEARQASTKAQRGSCRHQQPQQQQQWRPQPAQQPSIDASSGASSGPLLAIAAMAVGAAVFAATRLGGGAVTFDTLQAEAVPLSAAQANGRPTVLEFFATWCEVCRELLPDTIEVERSYKDQVNFVALNVDNSKWAPEVADYSVTGIPQYVFLDGSGKVKASAAGKVPRQVLEQNVAALAEGRTLPYARVREPGSELPSVGATTVPRPQTDPRAHG